MSDTETSRTYEVGSQWFVENPFTTDRGLKLEEGALVTVDSIQEDTVCCVFHKDKGMEAGLIMRQPVSPEQLDTHCQPERRTPGSRLRESLNSPEDAIRENALERLKEIVNLGEDAPTREIDGTLDTKGLYSDAYGTALNEAMFATDEA